MYELIEQIEIDKNSHRQEIIQQTLFDLSTLPTRFHKEYLSEVLVGTGPKDIKTLRKTFEYYLAEISNELSEKEESKIYW